MWSVSLERAVEIKSEGVLTHRRIRPTAPAQNAKYANGPESHKAANIFAAAAAAVHATMGWSKRRAVRWQSKLFEVQAELDARWQHCGGPRAQPAARGRAQVAR